MQQKYCQIVALNNVLTEQFHETAKWLIFSDYVFKLHIPGVLHKHHRVE